MTKKKIILIFIGVVVLVGGCGAFYLLRRRTPKTASPTTTKELYVALGDSVAAGVGLSTASDISLCNRTNESYPNLLATKRSSKLVFLACSGATTRDGLLTEQHVGNGFVTSQISQLPSSAPAFITITIGADDLHWVEYLTKCITGICGTEQDTSDIDAQLDTLDVQLSEALTKIENTYSKRAPVYLTGYYHLYPLSNSLCEQPTLLDDNELTWLSLSTDKLNERLQSVAKKYAFARFVPLDFSGHLLCDKDPWISSLQESAPYHPNSDGQQAIARQLDIIVR
jgi:lysophospholipase L1-like esterase